MESSLHLLSLCSCKRQRAPRTLAAGNTRTTLLVFFMAVKLLNVHAHKLGPCLASLTFPSPHWDHIHAGVFTLNSKKNNIRLKWTHWFVSSLSGVEGLAVCCEVLHPVCPCKLEAQISLYPSSPLPSSSCDLGTKVSLYSLAGFPDFSSYQHNEKISS